MTWHCPTCNKPHPVQHDEPTVCEMCELRDELADAMGVINRLRDELARVGVLPAPPRHVKGEQ
jgi:hypothetical protein